MGAGRPAKGEVLLDLDTPTLTLRVPSEVGRLHFSQEAIDALARKVADALKAAAERARRSHRDEVAGRTSRRRQTRQFPRTLYRGWQRSMTARSSVIPKPV